MKNFKSLALLAVVIAMIFILRAQDRAKVDVKSFVRAEMHDCVVKNGSNGCYEKAASKFLAKTSYEEIIKIFREIEREPEIFTHCHELMHFLGREEYYKVNDIHQVLAKSDPACFSGSYHGVVEGYLISKNLPADDATYRKEIANLCGEKISYEVAEIYNQCVHGIGHALMFLTEAEVPRSLKICDALVSQKDKEYCYSGVFMENVNSSTNPDHPSNYIKADDPTYPCNVLDEQYQKMCYTLQVPHFFDWAKFDWPKTVALCGQIPLEYQEVCYRGIGSNQIGYSQDFLVMKNNCDLVALSGRVACIEGVVSTLATRYAGDFSRMQNFCAVVSAENKKRCYQVMGASLKSWVKDESQAVKQCAKLEVPENITWCQGY